jgi:acetate kinase
MKILVANLGSTSFKYRLFDMDSQQQLARGGVERIGAPESQATVETSDRRQELLVHAPDHVAAVSLCLAQLTDPASGCLADAAEVAAIGFKAVHGGQTSGVERVDARLLNAMEAMNVVAPAHNPQYIAAMRQLHEKLPGIPLVAAFETGFHATIPEHLRMYAVPYRWAEEFGVRRWGFHGASHRFIAERTAQLVRKEGLRVISCHLGGSSSLCAIHGQRSVANSLGMSPQTGLPHNNRVGDFDPFALPVIMRRTGQSLENVLDDLACRSGLAGLSDTSGDIRDLEAAIAKGNSRAQLAWDVYVSSIRHYLGAYLAVLGGADLIAFTGGIGQNGTRVRSAVCAGLDELGIVLDEAKNAQVKDESPIHASSSHIQVWVVPTNEELIVARQVKELLQTSYAGESPARG